MQCALRSQRGEEKREPYTLNPLPQGERERFARRERLVVVSLLPGQIARRRLRGGITLDREAHACRWFGEFAELHQPGFDGPAAAFVLLGELLDRLARIEGL